MRVALIALLREQQIDTAAALLVKWHLTFLLQRTLLIHHH